MIRRLLVLLFLAVASSANAGTSDLAFVFNDSGQIMSVVRGALPGTFSTSLEIGSVSAASTAGNFVVNGAATISGPAGALPVSVVRTVSGAAVARAIATQAAKGFTPVAIGLGAYELMQSYRMRGTGSGLEQDPGTAPTPQDSWKAVFPANSPAAGSAFQAMDAANNLRASSSFIPVRCDAATLSYSGNSASVRCYFRTAVAPNGYEDFYLQSANKTTANGCAAINDALTGQSYVPGVSADGKCMTGRYDPRTTDAAAGTLAAAMTVAAVKDYISKGPVVAPVPTVGTPTISGPASQTGTPVTTSTTTTAPNGTVTTVNNVSTPVYNYTYGGNTITVDNSVRTTNTTNIGGATTVTETQTDEPSDPQCKEFPNSLGCLQLGELPDAPITPVQKSITVAEESVSLPSGCPADISLPGGRVISYATACDSAQKMAPLVIAAGVLSALLIAVAAIRSN